MTESKTEIELLYFEDCPSWENAAETLSAVLGELGIASHISLSRVETPEEAVQQRFVGSPTIRIDGEDLFPTGQEDFGLGCRVYLTPQGFRGWPTAEMLREKILDLEERTIRRASPPAN